MVLYINVDNYVSGCSVHEIAIELGREQEFKDWIKIELSNLKNEYGIFDKKELVFEKEDNNLLEKFLDELGGNYNILYGEIFHDDLFRVQLA